MDSLPGYGGLGVGDRVFLFDDPVFTDADAVCGRGGDAISGKRAVCDAGLLAFQFFHKRATWVDAGGFGKLDAESIRVPNAGFFNEGSVHDS